MPNRAPYVQEMRLDERTAAEHRAQADPRGRRAGEDYAQRSRTAEEPSSRRSVNGHAPSGKRRSAGQPRSTQSVGSGATAHRSQTRRPSDERSHNTHSHEQYARTNYGNAARSRRPAPRALPTNDQAAERNRPVEEAASRFGRTAESSRKAPSFFSSQAPQWFASSPFAGGAAALKRRWNRFRAIVVAVIILLVIYFAGAAHFSSCFYPSSTIGPVDVSGMTQGQAADALGQSASNYQLTVSGDNVSFTLAGDEAGLALDNQVVAANAMADNNPWIWPAALLFPHNYAGALSASVDSDKLSKEVSDQVSSYNQNATAPTNASLRYDKGTGKFDITAEKEGTTLDSDAVAKDVTAAIEQLSGTLTLTDSDYEHPTVNRANENLQQALRDASTVLNTDLKFQIKGTTVTELKGSDAAGWVTTDDDGNLALKSKKYTAWCTKVADKYTTKGGTRTFTNPAGTKITVKGGDYGWDVDEDSLASTVHDDVLKGTSDTLDLPMTQTADAWNDNGTDFNSYIEVDIGKQHATYYDKNGKVIWESDVVTGATGGDTDTSIGTYYINNKQSPSTLNGYNLQTGKKTYSTKVQYWMPWDGNVIGFHDAKWQSAFGGTRYKDGYGSNGCVNLPPSKAKSLYKLVSVGTVVVSHK